MYSFDGKCTYKLAGDCKENTFSIHQSFDENSNLEVQVILSTGIEYLLHCGKTAFKKMIMQGLD